MNKKTFVNTKRVPSGRDAKFYDDALDAIVGHDIMIKEWSA